MALTTNQGLELPDGTDNANVPLAMTNYNTGIENRTVQRYLSVADRTARNPVPFEGELSYLGDTDLYYSFRTGLGWVVLIGSYTSSSDLPAYTTTSAIYTTVGAPLLGVTLTAPPSGRLRVGFSSLVSNSAAGQTFLAPQLNAGAVIGAGATVVAASDNIAARCQGNLLVVSSSFWTYTGLTPGNPYNVFLMHRTTAGTATYQNRVIEFEQK